MRFLKFGFFILISFLFLISCAEVDDGPLEISSSNIEFAGKGYFLWADLDSGRSIHLIDDTLYIHIDSLWTFSNCALKKIQINFTTDDTILILKPEIQIQANTVDCAAPYFRPDTVVKVLPDEPVLRRISTIYIKNDVDTLLDTILVRRGTLKLDTFALYVDSLFDSVKNLPIRTKGSPSLFKTLDSLTPRTRYFKTMNSTCSMIIDNCGNTKLDTIFPTSWFESDTALVPVRRACVDLDSIYCHSARWENDSLRLSDVKEKRDTIWHTSIYYAEEIPNCASMIFFERGSFYSGSKFNVAREVFIPNEKEWTCGPSTRNDWFLYNIQKNEMVPDSIDTDSLYAKWKKAKVIY